MLVLYQNRSTSNGGAWKGFFSDTLLFQKEKMHYRLRLKLFTRSPTT